LDEFPFSQEDDIIDVIRPKYKDNQEQLDKYKDKDLGSIAILKPTNEKKLHLPGDDQKKIALIKSHPPSLEQRKETHDGEEEVYSKVSKEYFQLGRLVYMWDKRKGKPNVREFSFLWKGPYKVEEYENGSFFIHDRGKETTTT
jgi:hypothetical protein